MKSRSFGHALATIVLRASGYRVRQPGAHYNTFLALEAADPTAFGADAAHFDVCRRLRNQLSYESAGVISGSELEEILRKAPEFETAVGSWLARRYPELRGP